MNKNSLLKFIDKSKEIIDEGVTEEINEPKIDMMDKNEENNIISEIRGTFLNASDVKDDHLDVTQPTTDLAEEAIEPMAAMSTSNSIIAKDVIIKGNVSSQGNLNFNGEIDGDVECHQVLRVRGKINGNVKASQVSISDSDITGNVLCENLCEVLNDTKIQGDVTAKNVVIEGSVFGAVNASEKLTLCSTAVLEGDCIAARIKIEEGAVIKGNMQTVKK